MTVVKGERRGGRGRTSQATIIEAAVELVDAEGPGALTIRRLAAACQLSPMGIYRYVRNRDELLDLVVERVLEELPTYVPDGTWQQRATALFGGFRRMALSHPGVTALGVARVSPVPSMVVFTERALGIMEEAGLKGAKAVVGYDTLLMFTVGSVLWQLPRSGAERAELLGTAARHGLTAPHLIRHARALGSRDPDRYFTRGLAIVLAGLAGGAARTGEA